MKLDYISVVLFLALQIKMRKIPYHSDEHIKIKQTGYHQRKNIKRTENARTQ